jgi:hypothetical protein
LEGSLLNETYNNIEKKVKNELRSSPTLSLVIDESTNISGVRIINTTILTSFGDSYYINNKEAPTSSLTKAIWVDYIKESAMEVTEGNPSKIASLTTDTCELMVSTQRQINM